MAAVAALSNSSLGCGNLADECSTSFSCNQRRPASVSFRSLSPRKVLKPIIRANTKGFNTVLTFEERGNNPLCIRPSFCIQPIFPYPDHCPERKTLDRWVQDSIVEIVKNLKDAPFLHFIFDSKLAKPERIKVSQDVFKNPECWGYLKDSVLDIAPDGLILVQKLDKETAGNVRQATLPGICPLQDGICLQRNRCVVDESTDVWGVLVQGKSIMWSSCYILQTTRVCVDGAACTRFSLTRAQCFGPSIQVQMEKMWLS